ncbi:uncharacterized protein GGS25DRAFT_517119 [Hypoxylon fragiforme]|uniref:uncharacterized protein n=1 Tax=Hypoxylon fragiforme TaxID=63214 RepID=UPI0020C607E9|nr:uncharacterized protein GGS25DRAFT_517119 [Hypoxylon fragiforme]KAI2614272.1 hypothetical protein GGS25DRAFT_517119 [Hypoxylon fragiforme]
MAAAYQTDAPHFTNTFTTNEQPLERQRTGSRDYSNTAEWDASKTPPSRFQKRKGSIYATPPSRDGHVERNRDAVEEFHRAHSKRWSLSSSGSSRRGSVGVTAPSTSNSKADEQQKRKASQ